MVPDRLREALAQADDGLTARLIYIWPEPSPIGCLKKSSNAEATGRRDRLLIAARYLRSLTMAADEWGMPAPRALALDEHAVELFDEIRRDAMTRARELSGFAAGWHGKNPGRALRLALLYELLASAIQGGTEPASISADAVARAGGFVDYAAGMLDRAVAGLAIGQTEADAAIIARHLLANRATRLNERTLYQMAGFHWARDRRRRTAALGLLGHGGWLRRQGGGGGRPRGDWDVSPRLFEGH
jgi:hypothetical protein